LNDSNVEFDQTVKEMFETLTRRDPVSATSLGIHRYDHLLPSGTLQAKLEDIEIMKAYLRDFEKFRNQQLTQDRGFDKDLAIDSLKLSLFFDDDLGIWRSSPEAPHTVGTSLFLLVSREFAPLGDRLRSINKRIEAIPEYLRDSRKRITDPVELWIKLAIQATEGLPQLLEEVAALARETKFGQEGELTDATEKAINAVSAYREWLSEKIIPRARKDFAIGKDNLDKILRLRGLDINSDGLLEFAYQALDKEKTRLRVLASQIKPGVSIEEVKTIIKTKHPNTFQEALEAYRASIRDARRFILERKAFTVPDNEAVKVKETPTFMMSLVSTAAIFQPAKFDKDQFLEEHNYYSIPNTTVHEAYPGHHLQGCCANKNASLIRLLAPFPVEFVEGWAHYCEEYMKELGFDDSLESRFEQTIGMVWRATRMILDVKLARGNISFEEAVDYLIEQTGMERQIATIEVNEYAERPSYFLSYYLGKHMILELKRDLMNKIGKSFDEKKFHDVLLYSGSIPMRYVRRIIQEAFNVKLSSPPIDPERTLSEAQT
jgi:hypothetical protein